jgi:nucleoid-associated protein YgaU
MEVYYMKFFRDLFQSSESIISTILGMAVVVILGVMIYTYATEKQTDVANPDGGSTTKKEETVALPTTHVVVSGESLWSIAEKYYKSGYNWVTISVANVLQNPDYIEVDQVLTIPKADPIRVGETSSTSTDKPSVEPKKYTIVVGDTLWDIAVREYKDGTRWTEIAKANALVNPDKIYAGTIILLP